MHLCIRIMISLGRDTTTSIEPSSIEESTSSHHSHSYHSHDANAEHSISDTSSNYSFESQLSFLEKIGLRRRVRDISFSDSPDTTAKKTVAGILKMIKQMNKQPQPKIGLVAFMEMIQMYYTHVSMVLLRTFMDHHRIMPNPVYFQYYIYFLHYAEYYHYARSHTDIIDPSRIEFHRDYLNMIRQHLKYVYNIIYRNRTREVSEELTL